MFAEQRHGTAIRVPNCILDRRGVDLGQVLLLLNIVENDGSGSAKEERCCSTVENVVRLDWRFHDCLDVIVEVSNFDGLLVLST